MLTDLNITTTPATDAENAVLYARIKSGDKAAITEMIERNIPGVLSCVGSFLQSYRRFKHLREDLVSEGLLALTKTVNSFTEITLEKHPSGRIVFEIDVALGNYVDEQIGAGMLSSRSISRHRASGTTLPNQLPFDVNEPPANIWTKVDGRVVKKAITDIEDSACWDQLAHAARGSGGNESTALDNIDRECRLETNDARQLATHYDRSDSTAVEHELLDLILACCACDEDKMIVDLRVKGYTDTEIAEQMNFSQKTIWTRRKRIEQRFEDRRRELDNS